mgnify:CR=1 FL=1
MRIGVISMTDVNNKIDVRGDGSVILYQRLKFGSKTEISDIFHMRIRIPLSASKGYFRGSTSESNQGRATQVARNKFDELYNKVKGGGTLLGKSFRDFFNEWKFQYPKVSNESRPQYIDRSMQTFANAP